MPELPEVETIRRQLVPNVEGQIIEKADVRLVRMLENVSAVKFKKSLKGQKIKRLLRRGKYLIFEMNQQAFVIHLGMTGQVIFSPFHSKEHKPFKQTMTGWQQATGSHAMDKHTHFIFYLEKGSILFRDVRTFGKVFLTGINWKKYPRLEKLGPEPLEINIQTFLKQTKKWQSVRPIKSLLLDQTFLAGIGNIYADEALFKSKIHPETSTIKVTNVQAQELLKAVRVVLKKGIRNFGTSFSDYRKPDGSKGSNAESLLVYGRGGLKCYECKNILEKITVAQRGTVFCPRCQRKDEK